MDYRAVINKNKNGWAAYWGKSNSADIGFYIISNFEIDRNRLLDEQKIICHLKTKISSKLGISVDELIFKLVETEKYEINKMLNK